MSHRRQSSSASSSTGGGDHPPAGSGASSSTEGNVQVVLRIRPMNAHDLASIPPRFQRLSLTPASSTTVSVDAGSSAGSASGVGGRRSQMLNFHYDRVLGPDDGQRDLYEAAASKLVDKFIQGFNVTILAYGQTSSGKSYSMGTALEAGTNDEREIVPSTGLVPRAVTDIFAKCAEMERQAGGRGNVRCEMTNSFVELYNEDLLDLLSNPDPSMPVSERPTVSIREDKDGKIIWYGLRETKVHSKEDVMRNLYQGSVLRRTNETDMNAQSSRSHAIFSITLTQRKRVGSSSSGGTSAVPSSSASTASSSSVPPSAFVNPSAPSTPSRGIPRPSSAAFANTANARNMSPTPSSRPTTPSSVPLLHPRTSSGLRPTSTVGTPRATSPLVDEDDAVSPGRNHGGDWVTVTSKFHFVDLAGSERLKRTSAAGERMKEGISINSGLLALGNVISALGDPAKARTMTHIPYRDSKLTRLLQDSLGGNAHTLMIACVSPAEFNLTETLSTIKYANRARNIKNRAEVNQMEVGWDDIEHLQTTLIKLRKEHAALKSAAAQAGVSANAATTVGGPDLKSISEEKPGSVAMNRLNSQYSDLQHEHAALSDRYRETMIEVARLTRQVEEAKSHGRDGGPTNFAVMVQPVIEEYEKAIAQMEEELKLSRAALAHTNDLYNEQEVQLAEAINRNAKTETYNAELRSRIGKLVEREASNETYIRDLETKLSNLNERDDTRGSHVSSLRKEVAQLRESDGSSAKYLAGLEKQLATSETTSSSLAVKVDLLEKEIARRETMYRNLEARLDSVDTTEENKHLLRELDEKDHKVADLERQLEDAFRSMEVAGRERATLQAQAVKDESERTSLKTLIQRSRDGPTNGHLASSSSLASRQISTNHLANHSSAGEPSEDGVNQAIDDETPKSRTPILAQGTPAEISQDQLELQLRDLQMAHTRTLAELDEVSAKYRDALKEIAELSAKLQGRDLPRGSPIRGRSFSPTDVTGAVPRSGSQGSLASAAGSPTSERQRNSLGRSSSQSANLTASKATTVPNGQGFGGRGGGHPQQMPSLLSQESSSLPSSRSSWGGSGATLLATSPVRSLSLSPQPERSIQSLEGEIMSLQKVLKQREDEIDHLEQTLKLALPHKSSSASLRLDEIRDMNGFSMSGGEDERSPSRASNQQPLAVLDEEVRNHRMDELLKSMARMEATHRETVDALTAELAKTKRSHDDMLAVSRDQALNVSAELDGLRNSLAVSQDRNEDFASQMRASDRRDQDAADSRARLIAEHSSSVEKARFEHEAALNTQAAAFAADLTRLRDSHADDLKRAELERSGTLSESQEEHAAAISTLHQQHIERVTKRESELVSNLERVKVEHARMLESKEADHVATLERLRTDHAAVIARLEKDKADETERLRAALSKSREEHVAALQQVRAGAERTVASAEEGFRKSLMQVQADHESALDKLEEHLSSAVIAAEDALTQLETAKEDHAEELARVSAQPRVNCSDDVSHDALAREIESLLATIAAQKSAVDAAERERSVAQRSVNEFTTRHSALEQNLAELQTSFATHTDRLKASLGQSEAKIAELESTLTDRDIEAKGLLEEIDALQAEVTRSQAERQQLSQAVMAHTSALAELESHRTTLSTVQQELKATKTELEALLVDRTRQEEAMRELQRRMSDFTTSPTAESPEFLTDGKQRPLSVTLCRSGSPLGRTKPPPPTPPPNMPPPPLPMTFPGYVDGEGSTSRPLSQIQTIRTNSITSTSGRRSPRSSSSIDGNAFPVPPPGPDPRFLAQLEDQRENVKNLNKRLQHCEADLQANIDLVNTLEAALNDSERALRKARLSANDIAKERDRASSECETLRSLLQHARAEVLSVKSSADNDSRQLEEKMASEMRQRENAKRELEERLEAMQSRKSKFNCF